MDEFVCLIVKCFLNRQENISEQDSSGSRKITVAGSSEGGSELQNRIQCREFLDYNENLLASEQILSSGGVRCQNYEQMTFFFFYDLKLLMMTLVMT